MYQSRSLEVEKSLFKTRASSRMQSITFFYTLFFIHEVKSTFSLHHTCFVLYVSSSKEIIVTIYAPCDGQPRHTGTTHNHQTRIYNFTKRTHWVSPSEPQLYKESALGVPSTPLVTKYIQV